MKQGILDRIKKNLKNIPLKQNGITFKVLKDKNRIKIQGLKKPVRVLGLHQLPENCDIAKAELIKKPDGYYIYLTCYIDKEVEEQKQEKISKPIGIDFGIKHQLTLSNGIKINYSIEETKRLKNYKRNYLDSKKEVRTTRKK